MTDQTEARRERMEREMIAFFAKLMGDEDVSNYPETGLRTVDLDDFVEDVHLILERTNCLSDAFEDLERKRAQALAIAAE